ncbi:hypothetical protein V8C35DRAFT_106854 [Trichoderma chlorosporum]
MDALRLVSGGCLCSCFSFLFLSLRALYCIVLHTGIIQKAGSRLVHEQRAVLLTFFAYLAAYCPSLGSVPLTLRLIIISRLSLPACAWIPSKRRYLSPFFILNLPSPRSAGLRGSSSPLSRHRRRFDIAIAIASHGSVAAGQRAVSASRQRFLGHDVTDGHSSQSPV